MKLHKKINCSNCGAPIKSEICPYCGTVTGLDSVKVEMEYPAIECKEAHMGFFNVVFPLVFALMFGLIGVIIPLTYMKDESWGDILFLLPFLIVSVIAWCLALTPIFRFIKVKLFGREIDATVYGYMNDNLYINGVPAQTVKLLVQTNDGPKFILYQLDDVRKPYEIKSTLKLRVYKDIFIVVNRKQYYF